MSARRRRPPSSRSATPPPDDDLPELEPIEATGAAGAAGAELPELEPIEDDAESPIRVAPAASPEPGFDTTLDVEVPELEKSAIAVLVQAPLQRAIARSRAALRHRRVLVRFTGKGLIGSAVKDRVGELLRGVDPVLVVVRRGYGDETVHQGTAPELGVRTTSEGETLRIDVDASPFEPDELADVLLPRLQELAPQVGGRSVVLRIAAGPEPDRALAREIAAALRQAGALRATLGQRLLFDRALEELLDVRTGEGGTEIELRPASEAQSLAAIELRVPQLELRGRDVLLRSPGRAPCERELARLVELCVRAGAEHVALDAGLAGRDLLWPPLVTVEAANGATTLRVQPAGRSLAMLAAAFCREVARQQEAIAGSAVTIDWPMDFDLDAATAARCIDQCLVPAGARTVACTFAGEHKEPFVPAPLRVDASADGTRVLHLDTDAGKPPELARAVQRRLGQWLPELREQRVEVRITGSAAPSRTLLRNLRDALEDAAVTRLTVVDHGRADIVLPPLLQIDVAGDSVRLRGDAGGRDAVQVELALQRELEAAEVPVGAAYAIEPGPLADLLVAAAITRQASRVVLLGDPPVQVHPALFGGAERDGEGLVLFAEPGDDERLLAAQLARELPPLLAQHGDLTTTSVTLVWPGAHADDATVRAAVARLVAAGPQRVLLDDGTGPRQVHPEIVPDYAALLGKKDDASPPLTMVGIDAGSSDEHRARVLDALAPLLPSFAGRAVLLVVREAGRDVAGSDDDPLLGAVRAAVEPHAVATLVFRGRDASRRPYFDVVSSTAESLAVGARFADPRPRAQGR